MHAVLEVELDTYFLFYEYELKMSMIKTVDGAFVKKSNKRKLKTPLLHTHVGSLVTSQVGQDCLSSNAPPTGQL